jgi:hypothetical protein
MREPVGGNKIGHAASPPRRNQLEMTQTVLPSAPLDKSTRHQFMKGHHGE